MSRFALALILAATPMLAEQDVLLVLLKGASALGFYTPEGRILTKVPVGRHPHEMVISADGRYVYTTDNGTMKIEQEGTGGNTISVIDLHARKRVRQISTEKFRRPHGIAYEPRTDRLLVTTELPDQLLLLDNKRRIIGKFPTKGTTSHMAAFGPGPSGADWAYVSNSTSANVSAINLNTGKVILIAAGQRPEGSVLSPDGKELYVANREGASITIIDPSRHAAIGSIPTGKGPVRVDVTPDGRTLVYALMHDRKVEFADLATRRAVAQVPLDGEPVSLHLSPDGKLAFAASQDTDTVYVISVADRRLIRQFKTEPGSGPDPVKMVRLP